MIPTVTSDVVVEVVVDAVQVEEEAADQTGLALEPEETDAIPWFEGCQVNFGKVEKQTLQHLKKLELLVRIVNIVPL